MDYKPPITWRHHIAFDAPSCWLGALKHFVILHVLPMVSFKIALESLPLRVQNEQFSEEKGFILRYTEKEV